LINLKEKEIKNFIKYREEHNASEYIKINDCKVGTLYRLHARNFSYGIYAGESRSGHGFIGIRYKFKDVYLFTEYHWDDGPPFGTVKPFTAICEIPNNIDIKNVYFEENKENYDNLFNWLNNFLKEKNEKE
jgi:hypothetical protein